MKYFPVIFSVLLILAGFTSFPARADKNPFDSRKAAKPSSQASFGSGYTEVLEKQEQARAALKNSLKQESRSFFEALKKDENLALGEKKKAIRRHLKEQQKKKRVLREAQKKEIETLRQTPDSKNQSG